MGIYHQLLKEYWGYDDFRYPQLEIIESICSGKDTLGLMPTGGGKSLTFQLSALSKDGIAIVVTPLIALMKDQVQNLRAKGIKAAAVYSGMLRKEINTVLDNCIFGGYKLLYVSPERLNTRLFREKMAYMQVSILVIDECHCISQWGYDFRPSYLSIAEIRTLLPGVPVLALTATATEKTIIDIQEKLEFTKQNVISKSFHRENLAYVVRTCENKISELVKILSKTNGSCIIYVRNRKKTKEIALILQEAGFKADYYHAGLSHLTRMRKQEDWTNDEIRIMVSTNAFGMGIDKPNVRLVLHLDLPNSLEEYFQEAGRAGRDGEKAYAVILHATKDSSILKRRLTNEFPSRDFIKDIYEKVCSYFSIAIGAAANCKFNFELHNFCKIYHLPLAQTYSAIKLIELSGYWEYVEDVDNRSMVQIIVNRNDLYQINLTKPIYETILQTLLRIYSGLFSDFTIIDEAALSARLNISNDEIYESLIYLDRIGLIHYIPRQDIPYILFTNARVDKKHLNITHQAFEDRKKRTETRIKAMINYAENTQRCRSNILLKYFNDPKKEPCGICDVCLKNKKKGISPSDFDKMEAFILNKLKHSPCSIQDLLEQYKPYTSDLTECMQYLLEEEKIIQKGDLLTLPE